MREVVVFETDTGKIISSFIAEVGKTYNGGMIVDIPEGKYLDHIDVNNNEPVFRPMPDATAEIDGIQLALIELDERLSVLEG